MWGILMRNSISDINNPVSINSINDMRADFLVLVSSIECLADKNLYDKAYGLVTGTRRKKVDSYGTEDDRKRSLAAGVLLNYAVKLWRDRKLQDGSSQEKKENESISISGSAGRFKRVDLRAAIEEYDSAFDYALSERANGKPVFSERPEVHFNLSHSGNYVSCAVAQCEVGVDIEGGRRVRPSIENRFFSEEECRWVCEADSEELHSERFFRLWTLKEAYSKLTGEGISYVIGKAHFEMPLGDTPIGKGLEWQADFYEYAVDDKYVAAAVEKLL